LCASNLAIIPSRTEGFGLTALEALSVGLPFPVGQNSGFAEAIQEIPGGRSFIIGSEEPEHWAEAIKGVRQKGSEKARQECQELRTRYAKKYNWETQCNDLVEIMLTLAHGSKLEPTGIGLSQNRSQGLNEKPERKIASFKSKQRHIANKKLVKRNHF